MAENEEGAAMELVGEFARELREIAPNHDLLRFMDAESSPELDKEFDTRFWNKPFPMEGQPGSRVRTTILANYAVALRDAVATITATTVGTPHEGGIN